MYAGVRLGVIVCQLLVFVLRCGELFFVARCSFRVVRFRVLLFVACWRSCRCSFCVVVRWLCFVYRCLWFSLWLFVVGRMLIVGCVLCNVFGVNDC